MVEYADGDWLTPRPLAGSLNTRLHESYPSVSSDGDLFFFRRHDVENGASDILFSALKSGEFAEPVRMGTAVNTQWDEWDPCVSSDGSVLVFASKQPGYGEDDLYVSFKAADGAWSKAINLGKTINSPQSENRPFITADNKYLFFSSSSGGNRDVYWVDMEFVHALNPAEQPCHLAAMYESKGEFGNAKNACQRAIELNPGFVEARETLERLDSMMASGEG